MENSNQSQVSFVIPFKTDATQILQDITDNVGEVVFYYITKIPHSVNKTIYFRSKAPKEKLLQVCKQLVPNSKLDNSKIFN